MTLCWNWPMREAKISHMTDLIGQIPAYSKILLKNILTDLASRWSNAPWDKCGNISNDYVSLSLSLSLSFIPIWELLDILVFCQPPECHRRHQKVSSRKKNNLIGSQSWKKGKKTFFEWNWLRNVFFNASILKKCPEAKKNFCHSLNGKEGLKKFSNDWFVLIITSDDVILTFNDVTCKVELR